MRKLFIANAAMAYLSAPGKNDRATPAAKSFITIKKTTAI